MEYPNMPPDHYQRKASRTECDQNEAATRYNDLTAVRLNHAVIGMMGEVGELAGTLERWLHYGQGLDLVNVKEELGDLMWYVALACNALGIKLDDVMFSNIQKLRARFPEKFDQEKAKEHNRDREQEARVVAGNPTPSTPKPSAYHQDQLSKSYPRLCSRCGVTPVHKRNQRGWCTYCVMVDEKREKETEKRLEERKRTAQSLYGKEQTGHGFAEPPEGDE